ncbi:FAD-binding domain-containing protein, partial [Coprinellus micaceus]
DSLANSVKGEVVTPEHPDYDASLSRWAKNTQRKAGLVVFVKDTEDVVAAVSHAKANNVPVAVRGGGANPFGKSSVEDGLVIDLSRHLNLVRVDAETRLTYVGGGAVWKDVDTAAIKHGLATVGATVNHVRVTLHGGYGWLSGRHGLAIDNLKQVTIVTEDGSVLTANDESNQDLFWAVRGGGGNFGVITEFVLQLHPQRSTVYAGRIIFTPDKVHSLIEVTNAWYSHVKEDEGMVQIVTVSPAGAPVVAVFLFYNGSEDEGRANFKGFFDIGPVRDDSGEIPYDDVNALMSDRIQPGNCYSVKAIVQESVDYPSTMQLLQKTGELEAGGLYSSYVLFEYFPLTKINSVPPSATAARRDLLPNALVVLKWSGDSPDKSDEANAIVENLV